MSENKSKKSKFTIAESVIFKENMFVEAVIR